VSPEDFEKRIRRIFFDLQREWGGIPFEVANDGEVTALAGSMSFGQNGVLGVSMGTSVAGGYVTLDGSITPWLNELAFAPVDYRDDAPADEWSGDVGCAVQYFCQQGVARLAPLAGLRFPKEMKFAEQLVEVQKLMAAGDVRARRIYETIGTCFGYTIAQYADFYDLRVLLILGRVTSGEGGEIIIAKASEVLRAEFPELAERIALRTPDEKDKRHGQASRRQACRRGDESREFRSLPRDRRYVTFAMLREKWGAAKRTLMNLAKGAILWIQSRGEVAQFEGIILADLRNRRNQTGHFRETLLAALRLLKETDPCRFARVRRRLSWIVQTTLSPRIGAQYHHEVRTCAIDFIEPSPELRLGISHWLLRIAP
jgi:predicted NBD/HSP70 family sugar kinase